MPVDDSKHVIGRTTLREAAMAMHAHVVFGTIHIVFVGHKHLAQVESLALRAQQFALHEAQRGIVPAGAAPVLVLHGRDGILADGGEHEFIARLGGLGVCGGTQG